MALIIYEGFDHETSAADLYAGILSTLIVSNPTQTASIALSPATQFNVGQSLGVTAFNSTSSAANAYVIMPITPATNTLTLGTAVAFPASSTNGAIIGFTNANVGQMFIVISAGSISVFRGDPVGANSQIGTPVFNVITPVGWSYVELQAFIAVSGSVTVLVNGNIVLTVTNVNTSNDGTNGVSGILLGTMSKFGSATGVTSYFDDVYVTDSTGSAPFDSFLGPVRVVTQFPTASGSFTSFTGSSHHPNWQNVSEDGMDGDSSYNYSSQTGSIDTFVTTALPVSTSAVYALKITGAGRIDDSGLRTVQTYLQSGAAITTGHSVNLVGSYQYFSDIYTYDPATGQQWNPTSVNLAQFGYQIIPSPGSPVAFANLTLPIAVQVISMQSIALHGTLTIAPPSVVALFSPNNFGGTISIFTLAVRASLQQTIGLRAAPTVSLTLAGNPTLQQGLFILTADTVGPIATVSVMVTSALLSAQPALVINPIANIVQGIAASAQGTVKPIVIASIGLSGGLTALSSVTIQSQVISQQSVQVSSIGNIRAFRVSAAISGATASNIHIGLAAWAPNTAYTSGARVASTFNGITNAYQATAGGVSASTAPNGTGAFTDGSVTWAFLSRVDFADLPTWEASIPATLTQPVVGLIWNDGPIQTSAGTPFLTLGSATVQHVTSSTNTITLKPAPGEGLRDALASGTVPLAFNSANGVSFVLPSGTGGINYFDINDSNVILDGLQFQDPNPTSGSTILAQENSSTAMTVKNCIFDGYAQIAGATIIQCGTSNFEMINCLVVDRQTASTDYAAAINVQSAGDRIVNCTIVAINAPGSFGYGFVANSTACVIENSIIVGYADGNAVGGGGGPIALVDHCLFDTATIGVGGVDNGGNLFSKVATNQFVSASSDFRLISGADAVNAGVTASTDIPTSDDIRRQHRPNGAAWDIGAFEL